MALASIATRVRKIAAEDEAIGAIETAAQFRRFARRAEIAGG